MSKLNILTGLFNLITLAIFLIPAIVYVFSIGGAVVFPVTFACITIGPLLLGQLIGMIDSIRHPVA